MRTATVKVPVDVILDFAERLSATDLENRISDVTEDDELEIEIFFEKEESDQVDALEDYLKELIEGI